MKKVRFEAYADEMDNLDCHSPRPYTGVQVLQETIKNLPEFYSRSLAKIDSVELYERSNSAPYSIANKTSLAATWQPSNDLDLSMLDVSQEPRKHPLCTPITPKPPVLSNISSTSNENSLSPRPLNCNVSHVLQPIENVEKPIHNPPKESSFFIRRDNLHTKQMHDANVVRKHFQGIQIGKENNALARKMEIMKNGINNPFPIVAREFDDALTLSDEENCSCHYGNRQFKDNLPNNPQQLCNPMKATPHYYETLQTCESPKQCHCSMTCHVKYKQNRAESPCHYHPTVNTHHWQKICSNNAMKPQNAVDKKKWAIEKFEQYKPSECTDVEKPSAIVKEKREPTVADLFKIIKLQNEQLQLLQEKVDKFISNNTNVTKPHALPLQNYVAEHVAVETVDNNHKISIGVMTSFEMVHTSTVINKEIMKQTNINAQVQCNRSHISVKEVAYRQPASQNFLDGILPVGSTTQSETTENLTRNMCEDPARQFTPQKPPHMPEEKTLNECSLYNVQVDNATTPLLSPEQTMYLDVRDYSDSDSTNSGQSNVGWTYYNKVMTHVNNVLQDSDMPSSASALFRNTRQQCVKMHIDKTNISVTKRVKFGDELQALPQPQHQPYMNHLATTDTSMKMNQLAAKYLNMAPQKQHPTMNIATPNEMSFATRKYMERHQILQGLPPPRPPLQHNNGRGAGSSPTYEMPKFLDITALKQQPKLL